MARRRRQTASLGFLVLFQSFLPFASRVEAYGEALSQGFVLSQEQECSILSTSQEQCDPSVLESFLPPDVAAATIAKNGKHQKPEVDLLDEMLDAMGVLQDEYYEIWLGSWPDGIDWTRAVMGTHVSGSIRTLSESLASIKFDKDSTLDWKLKSNLIDSYFTHIIAYYFGEDDFAIRHEAFDDMLWVVLGWLEAVQFLNTHTDLHYTLSSQGTAMGSPPADGSVRQMFDTIRSNQTYHGNSWIPAFAHRARIFWDLASQGWDTDLCDGGMVWNPRLLPYKNAITNELFIAASISMYLYFPGDNNTSPFSIRPNAKSTAKPKAAVLASTDDDIGTHYGDGSRDPKYLKAAIDGYRWLSRSNMTDAQGLYTDGFHISGYQDSDSNNTRCDERENTVLTYNQGVLLTGLRGLWEATGAPSYLSDGHALIQNVIRATGYDLSRDVPLEDIDDLVGGGARPLPRWHGLGRAGVLEDPCDASAVCNQDATTFKGIYFHHLTMFCAPLAMPPASSDSDSNSNSNSSSEEQVIIQTEAFNHTKESHDIACASYRGWLAHNTKAALATRDADGKFGQWWTAGLLAKGGRWSRGAWPTMESDGVPRDISTNSSDHTLWKGPYDLNLVDADPDADEKERDGPVVVVVVWPDGGEAGDQQPLLAGGGGGGDGETKRRHAQVGDPNRRGRGRTVETQSGGLALLRAYWKIGHIGAAA